MPQNLQCGVLTKEYLGKHPDMPSRTIAKLLRANHPSVFSSVEIARTAVRRYRGTCGERIRRVVIDKRFFVLPKPTNANPLSLPESQSEDYPPYVLPDKTKRIGIIGDVHVPFHNTKAVTKALQYIKDAHIDCLILNGDIADCYALSRWEKRPDKRNFPKEREATVHLLKAIRNMFPKQRIIYKCGNHEERFENLLINRAPDFFGMEEFRLPVIFDLFNTGIDWVGDKRTIQYRELDILHGHEIGSFSGGVNPARTTLLKCRTNVVVNHYHRKTNDTQRGLRDSYTQAWSIGCLCELRPRWMPVNDWQLGFAIVHGGDNWSVENRSIINGKIV